MNFELYEGCKALVVGCSSPAGTEYIGKIVTCEKFVPAGQLGVYSGYLFKKSPAAWIVSGQEFKNVLVLSGEMSIKPFGMFLASHLMPLPPIEDPGIDDCTFTPIKKKGD